MDLWVEVVPAVVVVPPYSSKAPRVPPQQQQQAPYPGYRVCTGRLRRAWLKTHPGSVTTWWCTTPASPVPTIPTGHPCWVGPPPGVVAVVVVVGVGTQGNTSPSSPAPTSCLAITNVTTEGGSGGAGGGISLIGGSDQSAPSSQGASNVAEYCTSKSHSQSCGNLMCPHSYDKNRLGGCSLKQARYK